MFFGIFDCFSFMKAPGFCKPGAQIQLFTDLTDFLSGIYFPHSLSILALVLISVSTIKTDLKSSYNSV